MKLNIRRRVPARRRTIHRFLFKPLRWNNNTVLWLEWIKVDQARDNHRLAWVDQTYHTKRTDIDPSI